MKYVEFMALCRRPCSSSDLQTFANDLVSPQNQRILSFEHCYLVSTSKYLDVTHVHVLSGRKNSHDKGDLHTQARRVSSLYFSLIPNLYHYMEL